MRFLRRRGQLREYTDGARPSHLFQQVTPEEYLAPQYPPDFIRRYPEQAARDMEVERAMILAKLRPGDTQRLWARDGQITRPKVGLAVNREGAIARAWLLLEGW